MISGADPDDGFQVALPAYDAVSVPLSGVSSASIGFCEHWA